MENKTYIDSRGYRRLTDSDKLVHRSLSLKGGEIVHHIDRKK